MPSHVPGEYHIPSRPVSRFALLLHVLGERGGWARRHGQACCFSSSRRQTKPANVFSMAVKLPPKATHVQASRITPQQKPQPSVQINSSASQVEHVAPKQPRHMLYLARAPHVFTPRCPKGWRPKGRSHTTSPRLTQNFVTSHRTLSRWRTHGRSTTRQEAGFGGWPLDK